MNRKAVYRALAEAVIALAWARLYLLTHPFAKVVERLGVRATETTANESAEVEAQAKLIGRTICACSHYLPWNCNCMTQGLAAKMITSRRGLNVTFYIGVSRMPHGPVDAHLWSRCGSVILTGDGQQTNYQVLSSFS